VKKNCIEKVQDWADDKLLLVELYEKKRRMASGYQSGERRHRER
jgi:hypothetical protein